MYKVAHITLHGCPRARKIAYAQMSYGDQCHFVSWNHSPCHQFFTKEQFTTVHYFDPELNGDGTIATAQLMNAVKILEPHVDLFHVHNEPNWLFRAVKAATDKPIVFDVHDWTSIRNDPRIPASEYEDEKLALAEADGLVVCSRGYFEKMRKITNKPLAYVESRVPSILYPEIGRLKRPGLVYEGGTKGKNKLDYNYEYRNWAQFAQAAVKNFPAEERIYFYTANNGEDFSEYEHPQIVMNEPLQYGPLLQAMTQHSVGLVGSPYPLKDFEDSMPNKLFEYISSGLPVIVVNAPEAQRFVEKHGLGVGIRDASEVYEAMQSLTEHRVKEERWGLSLDSELPKLNRLYREVLTLRGPKNYEQTPDRIAEYVLGNADAANRISR